MRAAAETVSLDAVPRFADAYPRAPLVMRHGLTGHPLLTAQALAGAARRMAPETVEARATVDDIGGPFGERQARYRTDGWTMLRSVETLSDYRALLEASLAPLRQTIEAATGTIRTLRGFIFISAPGTATPFHFDAEYNLLFQIAGRKQFAVLPAESPSLPDTAHRAYHMGGDNLLRWDEALAPLARLFDLGPGDVLFVPHKCPHWVRVGDTDSVSLSVTWQSSWTDAQRDAHRLGARLGFPHRPDTIWPETPRARAFAGRVLDRMLPK